MSLSKSKQKILFILSDCPGYFVDLMFLMAEALKARGAEIIFATTSSYYEKFREVRLGDLGAVKYLSDFLDDFPDDLDLEQVSIDYWMTYPTYERYKYFYGSHANDWSVYKKVLLFYKRIFEDEKNIALVFSEPPSNAFLYIGYSEARMRGIPFFGYITGRLPGYFNIFLDQYGVDMLRNVTAPQSKQVESGPPEYMLNPVSNLLNYSFSRSFPALSKKFVKALRIASNPSLESGNTLTYQLRAYRILLLRKWRYWLAKKVYNLFENSVEFDCERISVLFPLHLRPEASTSVLARHYSDDKEIVRNIAFSLPNRARLFVKEHRSAIGIRDPAFYKEILSYPHVHLLDINYPLGEELHNFDVVVTLTSTVGFEALQLGIPVYLLGRVFYENYPGVIKVDSFDTLNSCLKDIEKRQKPTPNDNVLDRYLQSSFEGSFNYMSSSILEPDNIAKLVLPIIRQLTL